MKGDASPTPPVSPHTYLLSHLAAVRVKNQVVNRSARQGFVGQKCRHFGRSNNRSLFADVRMVK